DGAVSQLPLSDGATHNLEAIDRVVLDLLRGDGGVLELFGTDAVVRQGDRSPCSSAQRHEQSDSRHHVSRRNPSARCLVHLYLLIADVQRSPGRFSCWQWLRALSRQVPRGRTGPSRSRRMAPATVNPIGALGFMT